MAEVMIKIFILMVGFFFGFGVAGAYSIRTVAEKAQIREELEKTKKELEKEKAKMPYEKPQIIEINDNTVGKNVDFSQRW